MKPIVFTSHDGHNTPFYVLDPRSVIAVQQAKDGLKFGATLILSAGEPIKVMETAEEVLRRLSIGAEQAMGRFGIETDFEPSISDYVTTA